MTRPGGTEPSATSAIPCESRRSVFPGTRLFGCVFFALGGTSEPLEGLSRPRIAEKGVHGSRGPGRASAPPSLAPLDQQRLAGRGSKRKPPRTEPRHGTGVRRSGGRRLAGIQRRRPRLRSVHSPRIRPRTLPPTQSQPVISHEPRTRPAIGLSMHYLFGFHRVGRKIRRLQQTVEERALRLVR